MIMKSLANATKYSPGDAGPLLKTETPLRRVILNAAVTWDYFPGHHDVEYAKSQGQSTIFVNTMFIQGLSDRYLTEWFPSSFIVRRTLKMKGSILAGDEVTVRGTVLDSQVIDGLTFVSTRVAMDTDKQTDCVETLNTSWMRGPHSYAEVGDRLARAVTTLIELNQRA